MVASFALMAHLRVETPTFRAMSLSGSALDLAEKTKLWPIKEPFSKNVGGGNCF